MQFSLSILPPSLVFIETWLVRVFLLLAFFAFVPLVSFFIFDFLLYVWRSLTYEIPIIGGRARGKRRPRAPSLVDNPAGHTIKAMVHEIKHEIHEATTNDSQPAPGELRKTSQHDSLRSDH